MIYGHAYRDDVDVDELYFAGYCCHREGCDVLDGEIVLCGERLVLCADCGDALCFAHRGYDDRCLACSWAAYAGEMAAMETREDYCDADADRWPKGETYKQRSKANRLAEVMRQAALLPVVYKSVLADMAKRRGY